MELDIVNNPFHIYIDHGVPMIHGVHPNGCQVGRLVAWFARFGQRNRGLLHDFLTNNPEFTEDEIRDAILFVEWYLNEPITRAKELLDAIERANQDSTTGEELESTGARLEVRYEHQGNQ